MYINVVVKMNDKATLNRILYNQLKFLKHLNYFEFLQSCITIVAIDYMLS